MYFLCHRKLFIFMFMACFLFVTEQSSANLIVPVKGKVESYKKGVYTIQTSEALIYIKKSKLSYALDQRLNKSIGKQVEIDFHPSVISSFKERRTNRRPSSVEDEGNK